MGSGGASGRRGFVFGGSHKSKGSPIPPTSYKKRRRDAPLGSTSNCPSIRRVELLAISKPSTQTAPQSEQASSWYYCKGAKAYYPYVRECPSGWQAVPQTPPG